MKIRREVEVEFPAWVKWVSQDESNQFDVWSEEPKKTSRCFDVDKAFFEYETEPIDELDGFFDDWETSKMTIEEFKEKYGVDDG